MATMPVKVKICGITNWVDARRATQAGAEFLGFNFYRASPRYISPAAARQIARRLPKKVATVGVFVNEREKKIEEIVRVVGLDFIQLHGDESPVMVKRLSRLRPVIKALRVRASLSVARLARFAGADAILLDRYDPKRRGGTGKSFDWDAARAASRTRRIFLAGGLSPENVAVAIRMARPYAVDVCSGVESKPGKKDPARMLALIRIARGRRRRSK
ncbi:MAG: phosphoribosylanthranilate isomerase [Candidatus Acidiferrales bacterium]